MHKQEFERSVQQKMEELSFTPSAQVWERVQQDIRTHDKRPFRWWWLPALLVIGAGGWWLVQNAPKPQQSVVQVNTEAPSQESEAPRTNAVSGYNQDQINQSQSENDLNIATTGAGTENTPETQTNQPLLPKEPPVAQSSKANGPAVPYSSPYAQPMDKGGIIKSAKTSVANGQSGKTAVQNSEPNTVAAQRRSAEDQLAETSDDAATQSRTIAAVPHFPAGKENTQLFNGTEKEAVASAFKPLAQSKPHSKWSWGVSAQYGFSNVGTTKLFSESAFNAELARPVPEISFAARPVPELRLEKGPFFSGGLTVQRALGRRVSVGSGVLYSVYTTRQRTGDAVYRSTLPSNQFVGDLQGNVFYRDTLNANVYTNKYHLISVPLSVQVQPFARLPLEVSAGMQAGYVIGAKSLHYDAITQFYYPAKPKMRQLQWAASAGLQYRVAGKKGWELMAGPQVSYNLSPMSKSGTDKRRLYAYGLGIAFRKK